MMVANRHRTQEFEESRLKRLAEDFYNTLTTVGIACKKHGRQGKPKDRTLRLNEDHTQLTWDSKTGETFKGAFKVSGPGVENPFFKRSKAPLECCITLSNKDRQLHLEFEDGETAMEMKEGFQVLVTHTNYAGMKKEVASAATAHGSDKEGEAQTSTNEE